MSKSCTTIKQGYPSITNQHDCNLSHTGQALWAPLVLGITLVLAGVILWRLVRS